MIILLFIFLISAIYLFLIGTNNSRKTKMAEFEKVYITHRGLFNNTDIPENSIEAFKGTVKNGFGTELDVQLTKDNKLVVFHDESLKRICGIDANLRDLSYEELEKLNLLNTEYKIPLFKDVLDVLTRDNPLIVEIKPEGDAIKTADEAIKLLNKYDLNWTMESFNPLVVRHLKKNYPEVIRGQLCCNAFENGGNFLFNFAYTYLLMNFLTRPDYIAYDIKNMSNLSFRIISKVFKGECVAWTIKSEEDLNKARKYYKQFIFDSFRPKSNKTSC